MTAIGEQEQSAWVLSKEIIASGNFRTNFRWCGQARTAWNCLRMCYPHLQGLFQNTTPSFDIYATAFRPTRLEALTTDRATPHFCYMWRRFRRVGGS